MTNSILERDDQGRIVRKELSSEEASELGRLKHSKPRAASRDMLLQQAGYTAENAPEHLKVLAELASQQRSGSVPALNAFLKLTGQRKI